MASQRAAPRRARARALELPLCTSGTACSPPRVLQHSGKRSGRDRPRQRPVARTKWAAPPRSSVETRPNARSRRDAKINPWPRRRGVRRAKLLAASEAAGRGGHRRPDGSGGGLNIEGIWLRSSAALFSRAGPSGGLAWHPFFRAPVVRAELRIVAQLYPNGQISPNMR